MTDSPSPVPAPIDARKHDALTRAMQEKFGMSEEDAHEVSGTILEQFGDALEVNDETLDPSVRSIFYTLEAKKLVSFRREEYAIESGEKRRGFWWRLREEALATTIPIHIDAADEDVYAALPKDAWSARQHA